MYYLLIVSDVTRLTALSDCDTLQITGFLDVSKSQVFSCITYVCVFRLHVCISVHDKNKAPLCSGMTCKISLKIQFLVTRYNNYE